MDDDIDDVARGIGNALLAETLVVVIVLLIAHLMGWW